MRERERERERRREGRERREELRRLAREVTRGSREATRREKEEERGQRIEKLQELKLERMEQRRQIKVVSFCCLFLVLILSSMSVLTLPGPIVPPPSP